MWVNCYRIHQKSLNFIYLFKFYSNFTNKNVSWLHFSWATQYVQCSQYHQFPFSALTLLVGWQERYLACMKLGVCWWWWGDCRCTRLTTPVVTTTSIILSANKIRNGDTLVPASPGAPGKTAITRERDIVKYSINNLTAGIRSGDLWRCLCP